LVEHYEGPRLAALRAGTLAHKFARCKAGASLRHGQPFCAKHLPVEFYCFETAVDEEGRCRGCGNHRAKRGGRVRVEPHLFDPKEPWRPYVPDPSASPPPSPEPILREIGALIVEMCVADGLEGRRFSHVRAKVAAYLAAVERQQEWYAEYWGDPFVN
jgi:hypothetical protein